MAVKDQLVHRDRSHAMFGYDFMVDLDLNVWLLEINASPSMEMSTAITSRLCKEALHDSQRLVIDGENGHVPLDGDNQTGCYLRVYN